MPDNTAITANYFGKIQMLGIDADGYVLSDDSHCLGERGAARLLGFSTHAVLDCLVSNVKSQVAKMDKRPTYEELEKQIKALQIKNNEICKAKQAIEDSEILHRITLESISDTVIIEEFFRNLINSAPEGVFVQAEGRILFLNPAMVQILGANSAAELIGTDIMTRMAPEYHDAIRSQIRFQGETGKPVPLMDQVYLRIDGSRISVETTAVAIQYQGGDAHLFFVRDITERKKQEEALQLQALVLDQIHDHVTITDMDGVINYVNHAVTKSLGYSKKNLIGRSTHTYGEDSIKSISQKEIVEKNSKEWILARRGGQFR